MSDFQRIRPVITHYETLARKEHGADFCDEVTRQFDDMQRKYFSSVENPDYSANVKKFCYLYKYAAAHGYYIYSTLKRVGPKIRPAIFSKNPTRIACIGGGPGTEIIGLCRYFREVEAAHLGNEIEITVFDKESSWRDACQMVLDQLAVGLNVRVKFVQFDATDPATYGKVDLSGFHLVMANFFTSEIRKAKIVTAAKPFWKHVFDSMGAGKIFLVVDFADNGGAGWKYVEGIVPSSATTVLSDENLGMSCPDSKQCIAELEAELDHRPKKNAQNIVKVVIT